jgi:hypothetical protein
VPADERTPLGRAERPGPIRADVDAATSKVIDRDIIDGAAIMDGSRRRHDQGEPRP